MVDGYRLHHAHEVRELERAGGDESARALPFRVRLEHYPWPDAETVAAWSEPGDVAA